MLSKTAGLLQKLRRSSPLRRPLSRVYASDTTDFSPVAPVTVSTPTTPEASEVTPSAAQVTVESCTHSTSSTEVNTNYALFDHLKQKAGQYLNQAEIEQLYKAFLFAEKAHSQQKRDSGLPYITHPVAVCEICTEWRLDINSLSAALLHDVIEDQGVKQEELAELFNPDVAMLVDGLTKLEKIRFHSKAEQQAESFRKMLLAMSNDLRVILIKLADRLHNMHTLDAVTPEKGRRVSRETLEIYAPIADRLGLHTVLRELQNLCLKAAHPHRYQVLYKALQAAKGNRREVLSKIQKSVNTALPAHGIEAEIQGREKSLFSIHEKMVTQHKSFSEVLDLHGFRIIVNTLSECYVVLGILHQIYPPVPGKLKDYIAIPKINGYQSLHTTLVGPFGTPVEFQIRSREMHNMAQRGIVSHWMYKTKDASLNDIQTQTHQWLQSLLDIQRQTSDSAEFLEHIKVDLFPDAVFVLTPRGRVISLPRGATPVDFAYAIHTDIGNHVLSAKVNNETVSIRSKLNSGDTVEIICSEHAHPSSDWMEFVRTGRARSEIRSQLRKIHSEESIKFGYRLLCQALKDLHITIPKNNDAIWERVVTSSGANNKEEILLDIALGTRLAPVVARRFIQDNQLISTTATVLDEMATANRSTILIQGKEGQSVQLSPCCLPIPGDNLLAFLRPGYGLVVHTADCPAATRQKKKEPERWVDVAWDTNPSKHLHTRIEVTLENEKGTLGALMMQISKADSNILHVSSRDEDMSIAIVQLTIQVESRKHLAQVFRSIRHLKQVKRVVRVKAVQ